MLLGAFDAAGEGLEDSETSLVGLARRRKLVASGLQELGPEPERCRRSDRSW